jgi:hypothetical protein
MEFRMFPLLAATVLVAGGGAGCGSGAAAESGTFGTEGGTGDGSGGESGGEDGGDGGGDAGDFEWGPEIEYELRIDDSAPPPLELNMDRMEVSDLFGTVASEILLLEIDSTAMLTNTLDAIKSACGTDWQNDVQDPSFDCSTTALGQTFVGPDLTWQTSAEFSMIRILTMTPANSKVNGTSIEGLQELADLLNIGGGFSQILADSLGLPRTEEFLPTAAVVSALQTNLLETHPEIGAGARISMTLEDALADLGTLSTRLGPVGIHPGVLDSTYTPYGEVLGPNFAMEVIADSNLRVLDGADLSFGKEFISVISDVTGPTFDDEAEFDFNDPAKFTVSGLNPNPTVDLRFSLNEHPGFVDSCVADSNCVNNLPGSPWGAGSVWAVNPWTMEQTVALAGLEVYGNRVHQQCYPASWLCTAEVRIGQSPFPPGWSEFSTLLNLGSPPGNQYTWELLMEVAQVQLHDSGFQVFPEGSANPKFTVEDIPVGITGAEAADAVRPYLQDQASAIADYLLGDFKKNNGDVDFYYRRASDGVPYLFFIHPDDLEAADPYGWAKPGFFSNAYLEESSRISALDVPGVADSTHHKFSPPSGVSTIFVEDDLGDVYRVTMTVPEGDPDEITVAISKRLN